MNALIYEQRSTRPLTNICSPHFLNFGRSLLKVMDLRMNMKPQPQARPTRTRGAPSDSTAA